jgi:hypothetical protein
MIKIYQKIACLAILVLLGGLFNFAGLQTARAIPSADQKCISLSPSGSYKANGLYQSFKPTMNRLAGVSYKLKGKTGAIQIGIKNRDNQILWSYTYPMADRDGYYNIDIAFDHYIAVNIGETYYLYATNATTDGAWAYTTDNSCCLGGEGKNNPFAPSIGDFIFVVYGLQAAEGEVDDKDMFEFTPGTTDAPEGSSGTINATPSSSETAANIVSEDILAKPKNFKTIEQTEEYIIFSWNQNSESNLAGYILTTNNPSVVVEIPKNAIQYKMLRKKFSELKTDASYNFYLQARNADNKFSQKAGPVQAGFKNKNILNKWYENFGLGTTSLIFLISGSILVLLLLSYLIYRYVKDRREGKKF